MVAKGTFGARTSGKVHKISLYPLEIHRGPGVWEAWISAQFLPPFNQLGHGQISSLANLGLDFTWLVPICKSEDWATSNDSGCFQLPKCRISHPDSDSGGLGGSIYCFTHMMLVCWTCWTRALPVLPWQMAAFAVVPWGVLCSAFWGGGPEGWVVLMEVIS